MKKRLLILLTIIAIAIPSLRAQNENDSLYCNLTYSNGICQKTLAVTYLSYGKNPIGYESTDKEVDKIKEKLKYRPHSALSLLYKGQKYYICLNNECTSKNLSKGDKIEVNITFYKDIKQPNKEEYPFAIISSIKPLKDQAPSDTCSSNEFVEANDSTIELRVSINGLTTKADYSKFNGESFLPSYRGRYKDCLIFMRGYGQHYRLLTIFQVIDGKIQRDDYEHTMCLNPKNGKESYLFFYGDQPIKMVYNFKTSETKFVELRHPEKYRSLKGKDIESCNNKFYPVE